MQSSDRHLALFSLLITTISALVVCGLALLYLRRVRLERPAVGTFNRRDTVVVLALLSTIPLFYLSLPRWLLTSFLVLTFTSALSIGLRPLLAPWLLWTTIGGLLGANLWLGRNALGSVRGWQVFWAENDIIVVLAAVLVANLYVQGGMRMRHVAWFALALALYDVTFTAAYPVTNALVEEFLGFPLDPSFGMRWGFDNAAVGVGDLLVYALFVLAANKAYGRRAARLAMVTVLMFGAVVPSLVPLVINYVDARTDIVVPAQAWFGPVAYLTYRWLRRTYGRERTMQEFLRSCESSPTRTGPPDLEVDRSTRAPDGGELQHAAR
jgi:hypothetical protein